MNLTITDVKVIGVCSKCRNGNDEIPKYKDGTVVEDKDISCVTEALGEPTRKLKIYKTIYKNGDYSLDIDDSHCPYQLVKNEFEQEIVIDNSKWRKIKE